jgi:hypothetical protein
MGYFLNSIVSFSNRGFDKLEYPFFESLQKIEIENIKSNYLQGKGLRHVPRTVQILHNVVGELIENNELVHKKDSLGLYNTNDICALESSIDFDLEIEEYGTKLANPMKIPYTLSGATAGWIAIRNSLKNVNLTINSGRCGILSALNMVDLDFMDGEIDNAILLMAHFMGDKYSNYNQGSLFNKEVAVGFWVSKEKTNSSFVEIIESKTMMYDEEILREQINVGDDCCVVDSDISIDLAQEETIPPPFASSSQTSFLPFFINNIKLNAEFHKTYKYIIIDKKGFMGYVKFKISQ